MTPRDGIGPWRKSSYSGGNGNCVEVAPWHKSSYSAGNGDCVEVAELHGHGRAVRDSKDPSRPALTFTAAQWTAFMTLTRDGRSGH